MKIYEVNPHLGYIGVLLEDSDAGFALHRGGVKALAKFKSPHRLELNDDKADPNVRLSDFPDFDPGICCFSPRAWATIDRLTRSRGRIAEALLDGPESSQLFFLFEPVPQYNCLDFEACEVKRFDDGRVMWVEDIHLRNLKVVREDLFRVRHLSWTIFCSEEFRETIRRKKLTGFTFKAVPVRDDD